MKKIDEQFLKENGFNFIGEQNPKIKQVKAIIGNTKPNPRRLFAAEGIWAHKKLIEFSIKPESLIVCPDFIKTEEAAAVLQKLIEAVSGNEKYAVSAKTFEKFSERDKPDGLLALAPLPSYNLKDFSFNEKSVVLTLDGIEIPGNVGTMLRMADGAGLDAVFICNKRARLTHPKSIKGSMGAILSVPIFEFDTAEECRDWLKGSGFTIYLADTRAEKHYFEEEFGRKTAIVMGSERYGITRGWYDGSPKLISIPMLGKCDSLNVGVAATVLAYEAAVKNKMGGRKQHVL